jgi:hypothetical protein
MLRGSMPAAQQGIAQQNGPGYKPKPEKSNIIGAVPWA